MDYVNYVSRDANGGELLWLNNEESGTKAAHEKAAEHCGGPESYEMSKVSKSVEPEMTTDPKTGERVSSGITSTTFRASYRCKKPRA